MSAAHSFEDVLLFTGDIDTNVFDNLYGKMEKLNRFSTLSVTNTGKTKIAIFAKNKRNYMSVGRYDCCVGTFTRG